MTELVNIFVPLAYVDEMKAKFAKIVKQIIKHGLTAPVMALGEVEDRKWCTSMCWGASHRDTMQPWQRVIITGDVPKHDGWRLIASIDDVGGKPLFRTVPDESVPEKYVQTRPDTCDHCNWDRRRSETFLIAHDDGRTMQIGRQCIRDFLGWDVSSVVNFYGSLRDLGDEDERSFGSYVEHTYLPRDVVWTAAQVVSVDGFYRKADQGADATKNTVAALLQPPRTKYDRELQAKYMAQPDLAQRLFDATMAAWEDANRDGRTFNEWLNNIDLLMDAKFIRPKHVGILSSIVVMGLRRLDDPRPEKTEKIESQYVGGVGEKITTTITVTDVRAIDNNFSYYGSTSYLLSMIDESGNIIKWFASNPPGEGPIVELIDKKFVLTGTVKKHEEYKGKKSTMVTRCKMQEVA